MTAASITSGKKKVGVRGNATIVWRVALAAANSIGLPEGDYNIIVKSTSTTAANTSQYSQECSGTNPKTSICHFTFTGKATAKAINRTTSTNYNLADAPYLGSSIQFQMDGTDAGEPGSSPGVGPDAFALKVWGGSKNLVVFDGKITGLDALSYEGDKDSLTARSYQQILINGGNVQVHK